MNLYRHDNKGLIGVFFCVYAYNVVYEYRTEEEIECLCRGCIGWAT